MRLERARLGIQGHERGRPEAGDEGGDGGRIVSRRDAVARRRGVAGPASRRPWVRARTGLRALRPLARAGEAARQRVELELAQEADTGVPIGLRHRELIQIELDRHVPLES